MGSNIELAGIQEASDCPLTRFIRMATEFDQADAYGDFFHVTVFSKNEGTILLDLDRSDEDQFLSYSEAFAELQPFSQEDIAIRGSWGSPHRYSKQRPDDPIHIRPSFIQLMVLGREYWKPLWHEGTISYTYWTDDTKYFSPWLGKEVAVANIDALLHEVQILATLDSVTIRGRAENETLDPANSFLCYHRHPKSYSDDLDTIFPDQTPFPEVTSQHIASALRGSPTTSHVSFSDGLIIYPTEFVDSNLAEFYTALSREVRRT